MISVKIRIKRRVRARAEKKKQKTHVDFDSVHDVRCFLRIGFGHESIELLVLSVPFDRVQQRAFQLEIASEHCRLAADFIPRHHSFYR